MLTFCWHTTVHILIAHFQGARSLNPAVSQSHSHFVAVTINPLWFAFCAIELYSTSHSRVLYYVSTEHFTTYYTQTQSDVNLYSNQYRLSLVYLVNINGVARYWCDRQDHWDRYGGSKVVTHERWTFYVARAFSYADFRSCRFGSSLLCACRTNRRSTSRYLSVNRLTFRCLTSSIAVAVVMLNWLSYWRSVAPTIRV